MIGCNKTIFDNQDAEQVTIGSFMNEIVARVANISCQHSVICRCWLM